MVAFASPLPQLQISQEIEMTDYDGDWLCRSIEAAARRAGHENWWLAEDVARSVILYLQHRFEENVISLQTLRQKVCKVLSILGFEEIGSNLEIAPPPRNLSLVEIAHRSSCCYELQFFQLLDRELQRYTGAGVRTVRLYGLRQAMRVVLGTRRWNGKCEQLAREVRDFAASRCDRLPAVTIQVA